jgi:diguanylate cyclase (GGDEF)-like protein
LGDVASPRPDSYFEALLLACQSLDGSARAQLSKEFFRQVSGLDLESAQSLEAWEKIIELRLELARSKNSPPPLRQVVLDYLLRSSLLHEPVLTEFQEIQRLRADAATDGLTGLHNRRFFDALLERELDAAVRYGHESSLVVMDLNRFKEVNDTHGHAVGDKVLMKASATLKESLRSSDLACRIGGDEFAMVLSRTTFDGAVQLAERFCGQFAEAVRPMNLTVFVTVSYGVATAPREAKAPAALYSLADERLYKFKRSIGAPRCVPRLFPRIPLANVGADAVLRWDSNSCPALPVDFSVGGVGLLLPTPAILPREFLTEIHLPRLRPLTSRVQKIYEITHAHNIVRLGCSFIDPDTEASESAAT